MGLVTIFLAVCPKYGSENSSQSLESNNSRLCLTEKIIVFKIECLIDIGY